MKGVSPNDTHCRFENSYQKRGCRGRDRMVIGFITAYAVRVYHHQCCELESHSGTPDTTLYDKICQ